MPIYTFQCPKCSYKFTNIFSMKNFDGKDVICPKCKKKGVKRIFDGSFFTTKSANSSCPTGTCPLTRS